MNKTLVCLFVILSASWATSARAEVFWVGDFETQDLNQFNYKLNPEINGKAYTTLVEDPVTQGKFAAKIELHDDAKWSNGLRRVELQHAPPDARTAEGQTTYMAWSFYLPQTLPSSPSQQIGYWESKGSYKQMMAFQLQGDNLAFYTRQPQNKKQWDGVGKATPGQWHRIAMKIVWSKDETKGSVSLWFDGQQVVNEGSAKTLNDDNGHFAQMGLLRGDMDFTDVPVIYLDDAVEGSTLEDVRPMLPTIEPMMEPMMEPAPTDMGMTPVDMGRDLGGMPSVDMEQPGRPDMAAKPEDMAAVGQPDMATARVDMGEAPRQDAKNLDGVGCAQAPARRSSGARWLVMVAAMVGLVGRRRATRRASRARS